jgi:hypothetical protein
MAASLTAAVFAYGGDALPVIECVRHLAQLSAVLHYAHRRGWLAAVPPIAKAPEPAKRVAWLTREQADELLDEFVDGLRRDVDHVQVERSFEAVLTPTRRGHRHPRDGLVQTAQVACHRVQVDGGAVG